MNRHSAPIHVALIGYGFAGRTFHAPLIRSVPGLSLALIASRDADKVRADLPDMEVIGEPLRAATDTRGGLVVSASANHTTPQLARTGSTAVMCGVAGDAS